VGLAVRVVDEFGDLVPLGSVSGEDREEWFRLALNGNRAERYLVARGYRWDVNKANYTNRFKPYCSRTSVPMDDCCVVYVYGALRVYGAGTTCFIVPCRIVRVF